MKPYDWSDNTIKLELMSYEAVVRVLLQKRMYHILPSELVFCLWSDSGKSVSCSVLCMSTRETAMDCMKHTVSRTSGLHLTVCMLMASLVGEWTQSLVACNEVETEAVCVGTCYVQYFLLNVVCSSAWDAPIRVCWEEEKPYAVSAPAHCSHVLVM